MDTNIHILTSKKYKGPRCQSFDPMCSHASASTGESSRGWWTWPNPRDVPEDWGSYTRLDRDKQGSCIFRRNPYTKHGWSRLNGRPQVWCYWLLPRSSVKPDLKGFLFCFSFTDIELVCRKKPAHKSWIHFVYNLNTPKVSLCPFDASDGCACVCAHVWRTFTMGSIMWTNF